jgi:hypothetical protein
MEWCQDVPDKPGKYIVQTTSDVLKSIRTLDASLSFDSRGKPHWSFRNQKFKCYLKI